MSCYDMPNYRTSRAGKVAFVRQHPELNDDELRRALLKAGVYAPGSSGCIGIAGLRRDAADYRQFPGDQPPAAPAPEAPPDESNRIYPLDEQEARDPNILYREVLAGYRLFLAGQSPAKGASGSLWTGYLQASLDLQQAVASGREDGMKDEIDEVMEKLVADGILYVATPDPKNPAYAKTLFGYLLWSEDGFANWRRAKSISQMVLAHKLGVSQAALSRFESSHWVTQSTTLTSRYLAQFPELKLPADAATGDNYVI